LLCEFCKVTDRKYVSNKQVVLPILKKKKEIILITEHIVSLENLDKYFSSLCMELCLDKKSILSQDAHINLHLKSEKELIDMQNDGNLKLMYKEMHLGEFLDKNL